jgi:hypothetical protein
MPENRPGLDELTATIEALRNELAHLHRAMGLRAIIEQAKGVLMAQNGIGAPAAFDRLRDISQAQNARLVDVAATIVGASLPSGEGLDVDDVALPHRVRPSQSSSPTWRSLRAQPNVRRGAAGAVLDVLASGTEDGREAATLVRDFLAPLGVEAVSLWRTRADASIEQVGQVGYATDTMSAWRRVPLSVDIPVSRAAREAKGFFAESSRAVVEEFPLLKSVIRTAESMAAVPVLEHGTVTGVISLSWPGEHRFDADERARVTELVSRIGRVVLRHVAFGDLDWEYLEAMLAVVLDPWLVLRAVDEGVAGLEIEGASKSDPALTDHVGARLLAVFPDMALDGDLMDELCRLMRDGGRLTWHSNKGGSAPWAAQPSEVRAIRVGARLIVAWHPTG